MRAEMDASVEGAGPVDHELRTTLLGDGPSPLASLEGTHALLDMDDNEVGTPLGDVEAISPR